MVQLLSTKPNKKKRSIWDLLFNSGQLQVLSRNNNINIKNFDRIKENEQMLQRDQKKIAFSEFRKHFRLTWKDDFDASTLDFICTVLDVCAVAQVV